MSKRTFAWRRVAAIALVFAIGFSMANDLLDLGYFGRFGDAVLMLSILTAWLGGCFLADPSKEAAVSHRRGQSPHKQASDTEERARGPDTAESTQLRAWPWRTSRRTIAALVCAFVLARAVVSGRGFASTDWLLLLVVGVVAEAEDIWRAVIRMFRGRSAGTRAPTAEENWDALSKLQRRVVAVVTLFAPTAFLLLLFLKDIWQRDTGWLPSDWLGIALRVILGASISAGAWRFRRRW